MKKLEDGSGYRVYGKSLDGALGSVFIPVWMSAEELLSVAADMKPVPKVVKKPASKKKKPEAVLDGGE